MAIPTPVGRINSDEARAVQVRDPEDLDTIHSTVYSGIYVYVDSVIQRQAILDHWSDIMTAMSTKVDQIIAAI